MNTRKQLLPVLLFGLACICNTACKKTVDNWSDKKGDTVKDTLTALPDSRIITFGVKNTGDVNIKGAIDDSAKVITVYLPYFYELQFLEVNITLPDGATILPAASELIPVLDTAKFTYTVTGKSGQKTIYTVKPVIQQPYLKLDELSSAGNTTVLDIRSKFPTVGLSGINIIPVYSITSLYLLDASGKEVYKFQEFENSSNLTTRMVFTIGTNDKAVFLPDTDYWLQMRSYTLSYKMQYPVRFLQ